MIGSLSSEMQFLEDAIVRNICYYIIMKINTIPHIPVLQEEVKEAFSHIDEGVVVDCTMGYGGHSEAILKQNPNIRLIGIDRDETAIAFSKERLAPYGERVTIKKGRFSDVTKELDPTQIRGVLADIGVSSLQLDDASRGFGFASETLDMRMDKHQELSAYDVVNHYDKKRLEKIFREYGEVREYKKAADIIVARRLEKPFESAKELADFLAKHLHARKIHPATLIFQAIRIEVNDELGELKRLLQNIRDLNLSNTTVAIISFHSLEDRIVKQTFRAWAKGCICPPEAMRCVCGGTHAYGKVVTKNPITAGEKELEQNPRARSAKLRIFRTSASSSE
jgi:16S rRNA (cytosine1402-N4)-methyltransferase